MLVLQCSVGEAILLELRDGRQVTVSVRGIRGRQVRLAIGGDRGVPVIRGELLSQASPKDARFQLRQSQLASGRAN